MKKVADDLRRRLAAHSAAADNNNTERIRRENRTLRDGKDTSQGQDRERRCCSSYYSWSNGAGSCKHPEKANKRKNRK
jgi:hypothetical protein